MSLYLYQVAYTAESLAAQIREPQDRIQRVRPWLESAGAKLLAGGYSFGEYDALIVYEAADDTVAAAVALALAAGGALKSARTIKLLTGDEWVDSLQKAQRLAPQYKPAR